jgi:DNA polymerase-3 subunit chi
LTEIRFYHLQRTTLERVLPILLERTLERGWRAVVMTRSEERVEALNNLLWTYRNDSFLPHGSEADGNAALQPVWLTDADENPNDANVLFLTDGAVSDNVGLFGLCCELFGDNDEETVAAARERWRIYLGTGHHLTYWQQNDAGGWAKKAEANAPEPESGQSPDP